MMYQTLSANDPLSQGDIFDGCPLFSLDAKGESVDLHGTPTRWISRGTGGDAGL